MLDPRRRALVAASLALFCLSARASEPRAGLQIWIGGTSLDVDVQPAVTVEQQLGRPDLARLVVTGGRGLTFASGIDLGDDVRMAFREPAAESTTLFTGEVLAVESGTGDAQPFVIIRGANRLHRLAGDPKTRTFTERTLASIVQSIAAEHGLAADVTDVPDVFYGTAHQVNQTDLDFLLERAGAVDADVTVEGHTLLFRPLRRDAPVLRATPGPGSDIRIACLLPRLSSSASVQGVVVTGRHPETGETFVGRAFAPTILLGANRASAEPFGRVVDVEADGPIASVGEAEALARTILEKLLVRRISAETLGSGIPGLSVGRFVEIEGLDVEFDGEYYVAGVSHRLPHPDESRGGYASVLRLRRLDLGMFRIPAIDDEVLVAFESGDLARPFVVGSLWDEDDPIGPPESCEDHRSCCSTRCCTSGRSDRSTLYR